MELDRHIFITSLAYIDSEQLVIKNIIRSKSIPMDIDQILGIIPRRIHEWTQKDVEVWLTYIHLPQLVPKIKPHRIDGKKLLKMDHKQLASTFTLKSNIIMKKMLNWIQYLGQWQSYCHQYIKSAQMQNTPQPIKTAQKFDCGISYAATSDEDSFTVSRSQESTREICEKDSNTGRFSCVPDHQTLHIYQRCYNENKFYVCDQNSITFGRSHENSFFIVDHDVQPNHCTIVHRQNRHFLVSSQQNSGAWIKIHKKIKLQNSCIIQMGQIDFHITADHNMLTIVIYAIGAQIQEHIFNGFEKPAIKVGRRNSCDIIKPQDTTLSGYHGKFIFDGEEQWIFQDLQTTNGSWLRCLNDTLVLDKMVFRIGKTSYIYESRIWMNDQCKSISSTSSELGTCRQCRNSEKNCYFKPCHHNQFCYSCALFMNVCPICNTKIKKHEKIYKL